MNIHTADTKGGTSALSNSGGTYSDDANEADDDDDDEDEEEAAADDDDEEEEDDDEEAAATEEGEGHAGRDANSGNTGLLRTCIARDIQKRCERELCVIQERERKMQNNAQ